jgi:uncharacterized RDD family membrane protein YckC
VTASVIRNERARSLQGTRAGFVSRAIADGIDWVVAMAIYLSLLAGLALAGYLLGDEPLKFPDPPVWLTISVPWVIIVLYLTAGWGGTGRTIGKSVMGLRVIGPKGQPLRPRRAFARALVCASLAWVLLWVLVSRRNAGLHDILLRTTVVYDWSPPS